MADLFFSYSHKDEALRNELEVHLSMLKRQGLLHAWHDRRIGAGDDIDLSISEELEKADIILLLVSAHFLASDYCYDKEMIRALERHQEGDARVIPVIIHPCDWKNAPFGQLRATPLDGRPVSMFPNQAEALTQIAQDIRGAVEELGGEAKQADKGFQDSDTVPESLSTHPRSSNLRVKRAFSDHEVDEYLEASFEYISRYFAMSLDELQMRNENITTKFRRLDPTCFTASIYDDGAKASECTVWMGGDSTFAGGIAYFGGITTSRNQYNESLSADNDGYALHLRPWGFSSVGTGEKQQLSQEGAAEHFWGMLIERLQQ